MRGSLLIILLLSAGCAAHLPAPIPISPRPPTVEWAVGITFAPFTDAEWGHFTWSPLWRVEIDQAEAVTARGLKPLFVAVCEDDSSVDAFVPYLGSAWGIELGNEPNFGEDASSVNAWYLKTIARLRSSGYQGRILTAGVGNLDANTLSWLQTSIQGLPADVIIGWHGYSNWQTQIPNLLGVLNGRPHAMTESGYAETVAQETQIAAQVVSDSALVKSSGAVTYIFYQMHDGPPNTPQNNFGLVTFDGLHWRPVEQSLIQAQ